MLVFLGYFYASELKYLYCKEKQNNKSIINVIVQTWNVGLSECLKCTFYVPEISFSGAIIVEGIVKLAVLTYIVSAFCKSVKKKALKNESKIATGQLIFQKLQNKTMTKGARGER